MDDGKEVATGLLLQFGFDKMRFRADEKRSKYYIPDTQTEIFCHHPRIGWVEVATFGIYSPTALAQYDIPYPVLNLGLGVERLAMILHDADDVRALAFPQFHAEWRLSDLELAGLVSVAETPCTAEGEEIARGIVRVCEEKGGEESPCEFLAWRGCVSGGGEGKGEVEVWVVELEEKTLLCGPACLNEVVVHEGSVLAVPRGKKEWEEVFEAGVPTGIRFLDAFAALAARKIELWAERGEEKNCEVKVKMVRSGADVNIKIDDLAVRFVTSWKKKVDLRGPVFVTVVAKRI